MADNPEVLVVLCIDTEGPYTDPKYRNPSQLIGNWSEIEDKFLNKVFSKDYRHAYPDSYNQPLSLTWFILNWSGYRIYPVKHEVGYHKIYDYYRKKWHEKMQIFNDEIGWHYHQPPLSGTGNEWGNDYLQNREFEEILCRMLVERNYFPSVFRAGGTIENDDFSHWLEQWIPYDFSNRNSNDFDWNYKEADGRTIGSLTRWKYTKLSWKPYHPSWNDYSQTGEMKRFIARSLDVKSGPHTLSENEVYTAFKEAKKTKAKVIFSIFEHDFRDRSSEILQVLKWISQASNKTKIKFRYCGATKAMFLIRNLRNTAKLTLTLKYDKKDRKLRIKSNNDLFGNQPFLAIKYSKNVFKWRSLFKIGKNLWEYSLLPEEASKTIGIGANDKFGNTTSIKFNSGNVSNG